MIDGVHLLTVMDVFEPFPGLVIMLYLAIRVKIYKAKLSNSLVKINVTISV